jgi:hypothetical protein
MSKGAHTEKSSLGFACFRGVVTIFKRFFAVDVYGEGNV